MPPESLAQKQPVDRRTFLKIGSLSVSTLAVAEGSHAELALASDSAPPAPGASFPADPIVDVNVSLARWPFRRLPGDETPDLVARLRARGVTQAWAGSFDALLHRDIAGVNARLAEECRRRGEGLLVPFGAVNPTLPDWEDDVRRCQEEHGMPGIRLHPNYHAYKLDEPAFIRLLELAAERGLIVQIALTMEDERTQHPLVQVPHVDARPLMAQAGRLPKLRVMLINAFRALTLPALDKLAAPANVSFDIAMLEAVGGVANLIAKVGANRVVFGSHAPFYYLESALFKLREPPLDEASRLAVASRNAKRILGAK